jgi:hypothetical protein
LLEFLILTIFNKYEIKLDKFNFNNLPSIAISDMTSTFNDSLQIGESSEIIADKFIINKSKDVEPNLSLKLRNDSLVNSNHLDVILERLTELEKKIDSQSQHLDEVKSSNASFVDLVNTLKKNSSNQQLINNIHPSAVSNKFNKFIDEDLIINSLNNEATNFDRYMSYERPPEASGIIVNNLLSELNITNTASPNVPSNNSSNVDDSGNKVNEFNKYRISAIALDIFTIISHCMFFFLLYLITDYTFHDIFCQMLDSN